MVSSWVGAQATALCCKLKSHQRHASYSTLASRATPAQKPPPTLTATHSVTHTVKLSTATPHASSASSAATKRRSCLHRLIAAPQGPGSAEPTLAMKLTDLPYPVFLEVISYLSATDALVCRRISRDVRQALTRGDLCRSLIQIHFPRSREGRMLRRYLGEDSPASRELLDAADWPAVFSRLTRRYFHLGIATPWKTQKLRVLQDTAHLRGVTPWNRLLRLDDKTAPFHYWDPVWSFDPADGLLVYPAPTKSPEQVPEYLIHDLETGSSVKVPFDLTAKVIRRVRLKHGVLIFEWCEAEAYHPLNDSEAAHRHFATAYDVRKTGYEAAIFSSCERGFAAAQARVSFRSEWKIHYLGLPLSHQDRFFSVHNSTHYVVYIWQPTRSPWGEDDPLERLVVWELGEPSLYQPSLDPAGQNKPPDTSGPRVIRRMANAQFNDWGIRQSGTPSLRELVLDDCTWDERTQSTTGHVFFHEEEHRWSAGPHSAPHPPRLHRVRSTGIPLQGEGPRWLDDCGGGGTDGSSLNLGFCWRRPHRRPSSGADAASSSIKQNLEAPDTWPGRAPCWRHDDFPYLTVSEMFDAAAGVRISARQCFMLETLSVHIRPKLRVQGVEVIRTQFNSNYSKRSSSRSSSSSGSSGSRSSSRSKKKLLGAGWRSPPNDTPNDSGRLLPTKAEGPDGEEVQFADDVWGELLGKGFICGSERWLVGEDGHGDITVLQF